MSTCIHACVCAWGRSRGRCLRAPSDPISGCSGTTGSSPRDPHASCSCCSRGWSNAPLLPGGRRAARETSPTRDDAVTVDTRKVIGEKGKICKRHLLLNSAITEPFERAAHLHFKRRQREKPAQKLELGARVLAQKAASPRRWGRMGRARLSLLRVPPMETALSPPGRHGHLRRAVCGAAASFLCCCWSTPWMQAPPCHCHGSHMHGARQAPSAVPLVPRLGLLLPCCGGVPDFMQGWALPTHGS